MDTSSSPYDDMLEEEVVIRYRNTVRSAKTGLIVTFPGTSAGDATLIIGRVGLRNLELTLPLGGVSLYETPEGTFEIRVLFVNSSQVNLLITRLSPQPGIAAGYIDQNPENTPFSQEELDRIASSLDDIRDAMADRLDLKPGQLRYLDVKLDEMREASGRLGRKDWINYAVGTLTSVVITAAFDPSAAKALLQTAGAALSWLFGSGLKLLP